MKMSDRINEGKQVVEIKNKTLGRKGAITL